MIPNFKWSMLNASDHNNHKEITFLDAALKFRSPMGLTAPLKEVPFLFKKKNKKIKKSIK